MFFDGRSQKSTVLCDLTNKPCKRCEGGVPPLDAAAVAHFLGTLSGWTVIGNELVKSYRFKNYYETMAFVNASAWISHQENHHPDLEVGFRECRVRYSTHAIGGLSENDFICAAKIDALVASEGS